MNKELLIKIGKAQRNHQMCKEARNDAYNNCIPFTPYPLEPWAYKQIKHRFETTGKRTRCTGHL